MLRHAIFTLVGEALDDPAVVHVHRSGARARRPVGGRSEGARHRTIASTAFRSRRSTARAPKAKPRASRRSSPIRKGSLLGAAIVGPHAGELIAEYGLALAKGSWRQDISGVIHTYPTLASISRRVADQRMKEGLTPTAKSVDQAHLPAAGRLMARAGPQPAPPAAARGSRSRCSPSSSAASSPFFALGGQHYLTLETIKANRDALLRFTEATLRRRARIGFLVYAGAVAFSLPGGLILSLTMGFVFGRWVGTALVVVAATVGATIVFLAARYIFADAARRRLGALGEKINAGFTENAFNYMLFLRLVPVFPFFLVNLAPAFTSIPLRTFVLATFVGIIPGTFVFVNLGETLGRIDSLQGLVSWQTRWARSRCSASSRWCRSCCEKWKSKRASNA